LNKIDVSFIACCSVGFFTIIFFLYFFTTSSISFLDEVESNTFSLWNTDCWLFAITNNNNVSETCGENLAGLISDMSNFEGTWMLFKRLESTNSTNIVSTDHHDSGTIDELHYCADFSGVKV